MPDDILDAAQKAINDASLVTGSPAGDQAPTSPISSPLPPEPEPEPMVNDQTPMTETPTPPVSEPPLPTPVPSPEETKIVDSLLQNDTPEHTIVAPPKNPVASPPRKKSSGKGAILALLAVLLVALPVGVYFISQQNQELADIRSEASGGTYGYNHSCGNDAECANGYVCRGSPLTCQPDPNAPTCGRDTDPGAPICCSDPCPPQDVVCEAPNRKECKSGTSHCLIDHSCGGGGGGDDTGGDDTTTTPVCQNIKIYKGGSQVTDLSTLRADDNIVFAVKGNKPGTKARFRVNGKAINGTDNWTQTTAKNNKAEWTLAYTIPPGVTQFVIEGEVFMGGAWH